MTNTANKRKHSNFHEKVTVATTVSPASLHWHYQKQAEKTGKAILDFDAFWNKFRRRFPGTSWGWGDHGPGYPEYNCIGRVTFLCLQPDDNELAETIDSWGWFNDRGVDLVTDNFIAVQDALSAEPHVSDELPWLEDEE